MMVVPFIASTSQKWKELRSFEGMQLLFWTQDGTQ